MSMHLIKNHMQASHAILRKITKNLEFLCRAKGLLAEKGPLPFVEQNLEFLYGTKGQILRALN